MATTRRFEKASGLAAALALVAPAVVAGDAGHYDFGSAPSAAEIAAVDIDAMPDGRGLPPGGGTAAEGKTVYETRCAACHGDGMQGVPEAGGAALIGGRGSLTTDSPKLTIESYWPYATTVFDYVKRAMPFNAPGSLTDDEVYAVTAYILAEADLIDASERIDAESLPEVRMPNRDGFVPDPRPDVRDYD